MQIEKTNKMKHTFLLLFTIISFAVVYGQHNEFAFDYKSDLNSDGKEDSIILIALNEYDFQLIINESKISGSINDPIDGFKIIDIDESDKYKEIAVHTPGPSSDDMYMIYWYDGTEIKFMNQLSRWPEFKGNGIVYVNSWEGFWSPRDKYTLAESARKLVYIEQYAYYVGLKVRVNKGFKIYRDKELNSEVALLGDDSEIEIVLCDKNGYEYFDYKYLIKASSGLLGWSDFKTIDKCVSLPSAD